MKRTLFSVDIWKFQYPDISYLEKLCQPDLLSTLGLGYLDYITSNAMETTARSWERIPGNDRLHDRLEFQPLRDFVTTKAQQVWRELEYYQDQQPLIYQSWINVGSRGAFALPHVHYNAYLSAVVYIDAGPDQGNIVFESPLDMAMCNQPLSRKTERLRQEVEVSTGDVIIFPGWLKHYTTPNLTDRKRISFIANFNSTGRSGL